MKKIFIYILLILFQETTFVHSQNSEESESGDYTIKSVEFHGNEAFKSKRLKNFLLFSYGKIEKEKYKEENLEEIFNSIKIIYQQNGYMKADITEYNVRKNKKEKTVKIEITINEGPQTKIGIISFFGNNSFNDTELLKRLEIETGQPFKRSMVDLATLSILGFYANKGFLEADVNPEIKILSDSEQAVVNFIIREDGKFSIGEIYVKGLDKTKPKIVRREFLFKKGETVNYSKLLDTQRNLYLTGLFSGVYIRPVSPPDSLEGIKDIMVEATEKDNGEFNIRLGYDTLERVRGKTEIYNNNLWGTSNKLGVKVSASSILRTLEGSLTFPWIFNMPIRTDLNVNTHYNSEPGFDVYGDVVTLTIGRQFQRFTNVSFTYRQQQNSYRRIALAEIPENLKSKTRSLKLSLVRDTRDNLFNSTRGHFFNISNEFGSFYSGGNNSFIRTIGNFKYFYSLNTQTVLGTALEIGVIDARKGLAEMPLNERFYGGGPNSLRGFAYRLLGPLDDNKKPLGGKFELVGTIIEIRRHIYKMFGAAVFVDAGNIWNNITDFQVNEIRLSAGAGIRASTPVGSIRVDFSSKIDREQGESANELFFGMGQAF